MPLTPFGIADDNTFPGRVGTAISNYARAAVLAELVPPGGTTGQALTKSADTNHALVWAAPTPATHTHTQAQVDGLSDTLAGKANTAQAIPAGGTTGQTLTKASDADYAVQWATASGSSNQQDTGWRSLTITTDVYLRTSSKALIRRVGVLVMFSVADLAAPGANTQTVILADNTGKIPLGFSAPARTYLPILAGANFEGTVDINGNTPALRNLNRLDFLGAIGSWFTADAWPDVLPGTPA